MKNEDKIYLIPELEIRVPESWIRLVRYCQTEFPNGDLKIRVVNSQPTEMLESKPRVRFDKEMVIPKI